MRFYCLTVAAWALAGAFALAEIKLGNGIAARVNDAIITYRDVDMITIQAIDALRGTFHPNSKEFRDRHEQVMKDGLEQLIERELILDEFDSLGGDLPENVIDDRIREIVRQKYGDRATLTKSLQSRGMTFEAFRRQTREDIILSFMRQRNVSSAVQISPAKIERYYTNHLHRFQVGDQVKLRMIVLNRTSGGSPEEILRLAREITRVIDGGASFAEMASVYSVEASRRPQGGDWGWVEKSKLNAGLSEIAFALPAGQRSDVLALAREPDGNYWILRHDASGSLASGRKYTSGDAFLEEKQFGAPADDAASLPVPQEYYLMLPESKRAARTRALEEMREEIERELEFEERRRLQGVWVSRLKEKAFIRYY